MSESKMWFKAVTTTKFYLMVTLVLSIVSAGYGQDISLAQMSGFIQGTYLNPSAKIDKKLNIGLGSYFLSLETDGPSVNSLLPLGANGKRYLADTDHGFTLGGSQNIFITNDIHTLDLSLKVGGITIMAGHAFKTKCNIIYPTDLVSLLQRGNAPYIGKTLNIAPEINLNSYNELYLGLQKSFGPLDIGVKAKLLFGVANIFTDRSKLDFTTDSEYYQLRFDGDYVVRSSALVKYQGLDDIDFDYQGFSFDNLFYNNRGFGLDIGATYHINEKLSIAASALDLGSITWDFFPRKFTIDGQYSFDGIDVIDLAIDSNLSIQDTLLDLLNVDQSIQKYSTRLNSTFTFSASFKPSDKWLINGMVVYQNLNNASRSFMTLAVMRNLGPVSIGIHETLTTHDYFNIGLSGRIKLGPVAVFAFIDNVPAIFKPLDNNFISGRLSANLQF